MNEEDLERVLGWRNHPDIRRYMFNTIEIKPEQHRQWFERSSNDPTRRLLVFELDGVSLGFVQFSGVEVGGVADWGFCAAPDASKGTGRMIGMNALNFGFKEIGLHKICGQALDFNEPSIRFHLNLGFQKEGVLREHHRAGDFYADLICFGLLQHDWANNNPGACKCQT